MRCFIFSRLLPIAILMLICGGVLVGNFVVFASDNPSLNNGADVAGSLSRVSKNMSVGGDIVNDHVGLSPQSKFYFLKSIGISLKRIFISVFTKEKLTSFDWQTINSKFAEIDSLRNKDADKKIIIGALDVLNKKIVDFIGNFDAAFGDSSFNDLVFDESWRMILYFDRWQISGLKDDALRLSVQIVKDNLLKFVSSGLDNWRALRIIGSQLDKNSSFNDWTLALEIIGKSGWLKQEEKDDLLINLAVNAYGSLYGNDLKNGAIAAISTSRLDLSLLILDILRELVLDPEEKNDVNLLRQQAFQALAGRSVSSDLSGAYLENARKVEDTISIYIGGKEGNVPNSVIQNWQRIKFNFDQSYKFYGAKNWESALSQGSSAYGLGIIALWHISLSSKEKFSREMDLIKSEFDVLISGQNSKGIKMADDSKILISEIEEFIITANDLAARKKTTQAITSLTFVKLKLALLRAKLAI